MTNQYARPNDIAELTGMAASTCKYYRLKGLWIEGIHWHRVTSKSVLYNVPLIMDWIANRNNPEMHQVAIDRYRKSLPSAPDAKSNRKGV